MFALQRFPFTPALELRREMDRLFNMFLPEVFEPLGSPYPALNVWEDGERLVAEAEVPGLALNDLEILVRGNELTIQGSRKGVNGDDAVYHRRERGTGDFVRHLTLPVEIDADKVEATLKDGVLTVILPKSEQARARRITVKSA